METQPFLDVSPIKLVNLHCHDSFQGCTYQDFLRSLYFDEFWFHGPQFLIGEPR